MPRHCSRAGGPVTTLVVPRLCQDPMAMLGVLCMPPPATAVSASPWPHAGAQGGRSAAEAPISPSPRQGPRCVPSCVVAVVGRPLCAGRRRGRPRSPLPTTAGGSGRSRHRRLSGGTMGNLPAVLPGAARSCGLGLCSRQISAVPEESVGTERGRWVRGDGAGVGWWMVAEALLAPTTARTEATGHCASVGTPCLVTSCLDPLVETSPHGRSPLGTCSPGDLSPLEWHVRLIGAGHGAAETCTACCGAPWHHSTIPCPTVCSWQPHCHALSPLAARETHWDTRMCWGG